MFRNETIVAIVVFVGVVIGYQVLPTLDPEFQTPTQGFFGDSWRRLRDSRQDSVDVSDLAQTYVPSALFLGVAPLWGERDLIGTGRGRVRNAHVDCPLAVWARRSLQCDVAIGWDPCLYWVRLVFESEIDRGTVIRVSATAKRCRTNG